MRDMHFRVSYVLLLLFFVRANGIPLENEVPTLSWKLYMNILQTKLQVINCRNIRPIYCPGTPILNPLHTPKKNNNKVESLIVIHA